MNRGDLVRNKNSESGELGLFLGVKTFHRIYEVSGPTEDRGDYTCAEVYWPLRKKVGTIQTNMIEVTNESR